MGSACSGVPKQKSQRQLDLRNFILNVAIYQKKDSHNGQLFDFSTQEIKLTEIVIDFSARIALQDDQVYALCTNEILDNSVELFEVEMNENSFTIHQANDYNAKKENIWKLIRSSKSFSSVNNQILNVGDFFRIGKSVIQLIDYHMEEQPVNEFTTPYQRAATSCYESVASSDPNKAQCRVCLSSYANEENPLINPCMCEGSVKYIHLKCLQNWIKQKMIIKLKNNRIKYKIQKHYCEICKSDYQNLEYNGKELQIIEIQKPTVPFIQLKYYDEEKRSFQLVQYKNILEKKEFKIGKNKGNDLVIDNQFVDRLHAVLMIEDNKLVLYDNNTRYGTYYQTKSESFKVDVEKNPGSIFQTGTTLFQVKSWYKKGNKQQVKSCYDFPNIKISTMAINEETGKNERVIVMNTLSKKTKFCQ